MNTGTKTATGLALAVALAAGVAQAGDMPQDSAGAGAIGTPQTFKQGAASHAGSADTAKSAETAQTAEQAAGIDTSSYCPATEVNYVHVPRGYVGSDYAGSTTFWLGWRDVTHSYRFYCDGTRWKIVDYNKSTSRH